MNLKLARYNELRNKIDWMKEQPRGNRIKPGSPLEKGIREKLPNAAKKVLIRDNSFTYEDWDNITKEYAQIRKELENAGVLKFKVDYN